MASRTECSGLQIPGDHQSKNWWLPDDFYSETSCKRISNHVKDNRANNRTPVSFCVIKVPGIATKIDELKLRKWIDELLLGLDLFGIKWNNPTNESRHSFKVDNPLSGRRVKNDDGCESSFWSNPRRNWVVSWKHTNYSIVDLSLPEEESRYALRICSASSEQLLAPRTSGSHTVKTKTESMGRP
jgi:hypothetical protein